MPSLPNTCSGLVFWVGFFGSKYLQSQGVWKPREYNINSVSIKKQRTPCTFYRNYQGFTLWVLPPRKFACPWKRHHFKRNNGFPSIIWFVTFCFSRLVLLLEYEFLSFAVLFIHYGFINGISSKLCEVYLVHEYICSKFSRFRTWHVVSIPCSWSSCWTKSYTSWHHTMSQRQQCVLLRT